jgi:cellulose synthase/poly-beta-1,6-N-acetylglucosamine synthase-like glycosyltransferase
MMNVGLDGRWYAGKTLEGMACREVCFGIGRLALLVILIPLLALPPFVFFLSSMAVGIVFIVIALAFDSERNVTK